MSNKNALNDSDVAIIEQVIKTEGKNWSDPRLQPIKSKIKSYLKTQDCSCCYCRKSFVGEFDMVIDIEHILPKSKFPEWEFYPENLNIACKRCNMTIKGQRTDFLNSESVAKSYPLDISNYKFPHPNLETYEDHLKLVSNIDGTSKVIKYVIVETGSKGPFTKGYFELEKLEVDTLNESQGIKENNDISMMSPQNADKLKNLIEKSIDDE